MERTLEILRASPRRAKDSAALAVCGKLLQNGTREMFIDLAMTRNGLRDFGGGILIPVVFAAVADEDRTLGFNLLDEFAAFHADSSSPRRRTQGISPLVKSS